MELRKSLSAFQRLLSFALLAFALHCLPLPASASGNGISGFSGKNGSTCTACHSTGPVPTVTLTGPTSVASGSTNNYTLTVSGSGNGGLDVAASIGTFTAGTGTKVLNSEITHTSPSSTHSWSFSWTAPTVTSNTTATLFGASANDFSGGTGAIQQAITVTAPAPAPTLSVSPGSLTFNFQQGSASPSTQALSLSSSGAALNYNVAASTTSGGSWLSATPASGSTPGNPSISVNPAGLAPGTYSGTVTISSSTASNSPQTVPVTLNVTAAPLPSITASPANLSFAFQIGGSTPAAQSVSVTSSGATVNYTVASSTTSGGTWLSATPASGATPGSVSVSVNPSSLAAGTYNGSVTVSSSGASNSPRSVAVTLTVTAAALPSITASPGSLSFAFQTGGATPSAQSVSVTSNGAAANYTVSASTTSGGNWLNATPASGATPGSVSVSVSPSSLAAGTYNGSVTVASSGASNSPRTVSVTLTVTSPSLPSLDLSPASLSFNYDSGGTVPPSQSIAVSSSGAALSYAASASGGSWLSASPASGNTPGNVAVSVNPSGLTAGTYNGMVTISAAGSSNSPRTVSVSLTVTSAPTNPSLNVSPGTLSFNYQAGAAASGSQNLAITSSSGSLSFTASTSGEAWLSVSPTGGSTPGSVKVSVNATGLAAGTYKGALNLTSTNAANSPQSVPVTLTVTAAGSGRLRALPGFVWFFYQAGHSDSLTKSIRVVSSGAPLTFTADAFGGGWLSVSPSGGTTSGTLNISINPTGLASGRYSGLIKIAAAGARTLDVPVALRVAGGDREGEDGGSAASGTRDGGETETEDDRHAQPIVEDRTDSASVAAAWVDGAGVPADDTTDPRNQGLLLTKNTTASTHARAGVTILNVEGLALTQLGFDLRNGSHCNAHTPAFLVVTTDDVVHTVGGCSKATTQPAPAVGWKRLRFDPANPAQASPVIASGSRVKSIYLLLDQGPDAGPGLAVVDNININGRFIGKE